MSRFLFYITLCLGLVYIVSSIPLTNPDFTESTTVTTTPQPPPYAEEYPVNAEEDSQGSSPVDVLLDAAFILEDDVLNNRLPSLNIISPTPS